MIQEITHSNKAIVAETTTVNSIGHDNIRQIESLAIEVKKTREQ